MKRLLLVLAMLLIAGSVFAAELKISGDAYVRGSEYSNLDLADDGDDSTYDRFDYDLNLNLDFVVNEKATVKTKLTYDKDVDNSGKVADSASDSTLAVERMYINYKFAPFLQLNTGLMAGGQWATTFGDSEINVMRVQFIGALSKDMIFFATYQKDNENGLEAVTDKDDNEKADQQTYYLSGIFNFGPISVKPLFTFTQMGINYNNEVYDAVYAGAYDLAYAAAVAGGATPYVAADAAYTAADAAATAADNGKGYDATAMSFTLGLNGDFGMVGFESEFVYVDMDTDGFYDDYTTIAEALGAYDGATYGIYVNLFAKLDPVTVGFIYAYASADDEDGYYSWGEDFDIACVMDDFINNGDTNAATLYGDNLIGFTAYKVYVDAKAGAIKAGAAVIYGESNIDDDDSKFTEIDAYVGYAFDDNTSYTIGGGYAMTEDWDAEGDEENAYRVYNKFAVKF